MDEERGSISSPSICTYRSRSKSEIIYEGLEMRRAGHSGRKCRMRMLDSCPYTLLGSFPGPSMLLLVVLDLAILRLFLLHILRTIPRDGPQEA